MSKITDKFKNPYLKSVRKARESIEGFSDVDTRSFDPMDADSSRFDNDCSMFNGTRSEFNDLNPSAFKNLNNQDINVDLNNEKSYDFGAIPKCKN